MFEIVHRTMLVQSKTFQAQRVHVGEYSLSEGKSTSSYSDDHIGLDKQKFSA